ncbi:hypothetical protein AOLI_G00049270 [Acnodon oligacanthus]
MGLEGRWGRESRPPSLYSRTILSKALILVLRLNAPKIIPLSLPALLTALQLAASRRCLQARSGVEQCEPPTEIHRYSPSSAGGIVSAPTGREGSQQVLHPEQTTQEARPASVRAGDAESRAECELWHGESS